MFSILSVLDAKHFFTEFWFYLVFIVSKGSIFGIFLLPPDFIHTYASKSFSLGLSNNVSGKHPVFLIYFYNLQLSHTNLFMKNSLLLLLLGSYWSANEFNWGGYWSFDFVETSLLVIIFYNTLLFHKNFTQSFNTNPFYFQEFLFFFLFLKFNSVDSIHSFISSSPNNYFFHISFLFFIPKLVVSWPIYWYYFIYMYYSYFLSINLLVLSLTIQKPRKFLQKHCLLLLIWLFSLYFIYKTLSVIFLYPKIYHNYLFFGSTRVFTLQLSFRFFFILNHFNSLVFYTPDYFNINNLTYFIYKMTSL